MIFERIAYIFLKNMIDYKRGEKNMSALNLVSALCY